MVKILKPIWQLAPAYFEFIEEMRLNGETVWEGMVPRENEGPEEFVARLHWEEIHPGPSLVPQSTYWGVIDDGKVVGRIALRHHLNEKLREFGGHIGYEVRPSLRRCGIAKEMLEKILETPKAKEIGRLLLTCAPNNEASNKTITANGGILEKTAYVATRKRDTNYYWIDLKKM
jgi:predicted acetyltransferase